MHPSYTVLSFVTYLDQRGRTSTNKPFTDKDTPQARKQAFDYAGSLKDVIEQEYTKDGVIKSYVVAILFRVPELRLEEIVYLEGTVIDAQALELFTEEWKVKYKDILDGWAKEYAYYKDMGLTSGEPGTIADGDGEEVEVLPEVVDYMMKGI